MKKFAAKLTNEQIKIARKIESAGIASFSQAVKAFERNEKQTIEKWLAMLNSTATKRPGQV